MKEHNWILPVYDLPKNLGGQKIMRVVFRPDITEQITDFLWDKMKKEYEILKTTKEKQLMQFDSLRYNGKD